MARRSLFLAWEVVSLEAATEEALMEAEGMGVERMLATKVSAAHRWASPVSRPVEEPSGAAARAAARVVTAKAVKRVAVERAAETKRRLRGQLR